MDSFKQKREQAIQFIKDTNNSLSLRQDMLRWLRRNSFRHYCEYMLPDINFAWFNYIMMDSIQDALDIGIGNIIFELPPRHLKTLLGANMLASFYFGFKPNDQIIYTTYNEDRAKSFTTKDLKNTLMSERYENLFESRLKWNEEVEMDMKTKKSKRATNLAFSNTQTDRGAFQAAGRGNAITGEGGNLIIIDDYCKNSEEAMSPKIRDSTWNWYVSTIKSRSEGKIIKMVFATRWHSDDLIGRIKKEDSDNEDPDYLPWKIISFPAQMEEKFLNKDYDTRNIGEYLFKDRNHVYAEAKKDARVWEALYQQTPLDQDGLLFQRDYIDWYQELPESGQVWISVDPNKKVTSRSDAAGITVWNVKYINYDTNKYYLLEFQKPKLQWMELITRIYQLMIKYPKANLLIETNMGQGLYEMCKLKYGERVKGITSTLSKSERAQSAIVQFANGNVYLPTRERCRDIDQYINQWLQFTGQPGGADDLVDSTSQLIIETTRRVLFVPKDDYRTKKTPNMYESHFGKSNNMLNSTLNNSNPFAKRGNP